MQPATNPVKSNSSASNFFNGLATANQPRLTIIKQNFW